LNRILAIGIDSLDRHILKQFGNDLPNFSRLIKNGFDIQAESVFPPDSPTCWASIYTGLTPAAHGILDFVDPL